MLVLLLAQRRLPAVGAVAANLVALGVVSLVVMLACRLLDLGPWSDGTWARVEDAGRFCAAWCPMSICLARDLRGGSTGKVVAFLVVLVSLLVGSMLAAALRFEDTRAVWSAWLLAIAASFLWVHGQRST